MDVIATHTGQVVEVHDPQRCAGQFCCVHNPSDHPLRDAPLHWRSDRMLMERICVHGIGHPDPDGLAYMRRAWVPGADGAGVHGCDLCCVPRFTCPRCGRTSNHPRDREEGYCGACHDWTGDSP